MRRTRLRMKGKQGGTGKIYSSPISYEEFVYDMWHTLCVHLKSELIRDDMTDVCLAHLPHIKGT